MGAACGGEGPHFAAYPEEWSSAACNTADHGKCPQGGRKAGAAQARRQYGGPTKKEGRALAGTASRRWKRGWTNIHTTRSSPDLSQQSLSTWLSKRRAQVLSATGEQQLVIVRRGWLLRVIPPPCRWCWEKHTSPRFRGYRKAPTASVFRELVGFLHVTVQLKAAACGLASVVVRSAAEKGERNKKTRGQERDFTARALASMEEAVAAISPSLGLTAKTRLVVVGFAQFCIFLRVRGMPMQQRRVTSRRSSRRTRLHRSLFDEDATEDGPHNHERKDTDASSGTGQRLVATLLGEGSGAISS